MNKILLVASVQSHIAQFHKPLCRLMKDHNYEVYVAARNNLKEKNGLKLENVDKVFDVCFRRNPLSFKNILAARQLRRIIKEYGFDIINLNTPACGLFGRIICRKFRKQGTKVFYTAHGFHFYKNAPLLNWLVYYPLEKIMSKYTDKLITICDEDYRTAKKKFRCSVHRINGVGVSVERFALPKYNGHDSLNILCIGELNKNKDQITLLKAAKVLLESNTNFHIYIAGNGPKKDKLSNFIKKNKLIDRIELIGYCPDIEKYIRLCNVIVSCSIREGLGLNIIEGMIAKRVVVGSYNRGHNELINNPLFQFKPKDYKCLSSVLINLAKKKIENIDDVIENNYCKALNYSSEVVYKQLENIYFNKS